MTSVAVHAVRGHCVSLQKFCSSLLRRRPKRILSALDAICLHSQHCKIRRQGLLTNKLHSTARTQMRVAPCFASTLEREHQRECSVCTRAGLLPLQGVLLSQCPKPCDNRFEKKAGATSSLQLNVITNFPANTAGDGWSCKAVCIKRERADTPAWSARVNGMRNL
jgi:hypothetical protein